MLAWSRIIVELNELVFKNNYKVTDGASEIIKTYLQNNPKINKIIIFTDNSFGPGNFFSKIGFKEIKETKGTLNFFSIKSNDLKETIEDSNSSYYPVYDCGTTKWSLII